jgi:hypothetical protein
LSETIDASPDRARPTALNSATAAVPFGNDPAKTDRYQAFRNRHFVPRPLGGFNLAGWFPMQEFRACRAWRSLKFVTPGMIEPQAFLDDRLRLLREGEIVGDDMIRGNADEVRLLVDSLDPRGLFLNIMVENIAAVDSSRPVFGM